LILLVLFVDLTRVVAISTFALLFYYTLANIAALKLKTAESYLKAVSALGAAACISFLIITIFFKPEAWVAGIATLAVGGFYYYLKEKLMV